MMRRVLAAAVLAGLVAGCDGGAVPVQAGTGEVSGKVLVAGKPLAAGTVAFFPDNGNDERFTVVQPDGSFSLVLPPGKYHVQVEPPSVRGGAKGAATAIPKKYQAHKTAGLDVDIPAGGKKLDDFDLK